MGVLFVTTPLAAGGLVIHARLGGGAFADASPIQVYGEKEPSSNGIMAMAGYFLGRFRFGKELRGKSGEVRVTGSIVQEMALVATGALQYAAFSSPKIWDVAAGVLIVHEAGGQPLVRTASRRWKPLGSFLEPGAGLPANGDLRKWGADLLVGNPSVVDLVARNLLPRSRPWRWLRFLGLGRRIRSRARVRHAADQAGGKPDTQSSPSPDSEGPQAPPA